MNSKILEKRLIVFSVSIIDISRKIENSNTGQYLSHQMVRSAISPSLNYGETQSAESLKDFIHKLKISVKELRGTHVSLKILEKANLCKSPTSMSQATQECNELISIFVSSIKTYQNKLKGNK